MWKLSEFRTTDSNFRMTENFRILTQRTSNFLHLRSNFPMCCKLSDFDTIDSNFDTIDSNFDTIDSNWLQFWYNWLQFWYYWLQFSNKRGFRFQQNHPISLYPNFWILDKLAPNFIQWKFKILAEHTSNLLQLRSKFPKRKLSDFGTADSNFRTREVLGFDKTVQFPYIQTFGFWSNWLQISYNKSLGFRQNARPISYNCGPISQCVNFRILVQPTPIFEQWKLWISTKHKSIFHNSHVLFSKLQSILPQNRNFNFPNNTRLGFLTSLTVFFK